MPGTSLELPWAPCTPSRSPFGYAFTVSLCCRQPRPQRTPLPCPSSKAFHVSLSHGFSRLVPTASVSPGTAALPVASNRHGCCQILASHLSWMPVIAPGPRLELGWFSTKCHPGLPLFLLLFWNEWHFISVVEPGGRLARLPHTRPWAVGYTRSQDHCNHSRHLWSAKIGRAHV